MTNHTQLFESLFFLGQALDRLVFFATVQTFPLEPKLPLASFKTFFLLALDATAFTDLGIILKFYERPAVCFPHTLGGWHTLGFTFSGAGGAAFPAALATVRQPSFRKRRCYFTRRLFTFASSAGATSAE